MSWTPGGVEMSSTDVAAMKAEVAEWVIAKGWNDNRTFGDELILIVSELVEALEAFRDRGYAEWYSYQPVVDGIKMPKMTVDQIIALRRNGAIIEAGPPRREGVAPEIAGAFVRILDTCAKHDIELGAEFRKEMDYNWTRAFRHGGKGL